MSDSQPQRVGVSPEQPPNKPQQELLLFPPPLLQEADRGLEP